jgi:hypothetical protein
LKNSLVKINDFETLLIYNFCSKWCAILGNIKLKAAQPELVYYVKLTCYNNIDAIKCKRNTLEQLKIRAGYNL